MGGRVKGDGFHHVFHHESDHPTTVSLVGDTSYTMLCVFFPTGKSGSSLYDALLFQRSYVPGLRASFPTSSFFDKLADEF